MAQIIGIKGDLAGRSFELGDETLIGRSPEAALKLVDPASSRRHARIRCTPAGVIIEDLQSGNGTYVNRRRITAPTVLQDQDVIQISQQVFRFGAGARAAAAQAPRPAEAAPRASEPAAMAPAAPEAAGVRIDEAEPAAGSAIEGKLDVGATMVGALFMAPGADAAKANQRLQTVLRISEALQAELDLRALLSLVLDNLFEVFPQADRGFLMLHDAQGRLRPAAARNRQGQTEEITISRRIVSEVTEKRVAVLSRDAMGDSRFGGALSIQTFQIRSMMCAPLIAKEEVLGILHVDTARQEQRFIQDDLQLLTGVAAQTALAIASARMHERLLLRDRTERDLKIATQVQRSFLPSRMPEVEGMEFAAFYRSALEIGGDLYDFVAQPDDGMVVAIGDVSGKGIPAALLMARMSSDVRFYSVQRREPKDILPRLNDRMEESGMSDVFVTMALARVDLKTHEVLVGNAAHCLPLVRRAAEGDVAAIETDPGFPLGVAPGFEFSQAPYALRPGDVVCLYTDGVTEAMDAGKNQYGEERLLRAIAAAPPTAKGVMEAVLADVEKHVGDTKQSDDLTCVCFGVTA